MYTRGETQTAGVYLFDTMSFAEHWQVTAGFRVDSLRDRVRQRGVVDRRHAIRRCPSARWFRRTLQVDDTLFSYKVGVLFKPVENGSIYLSHAMSQQPPGGANFALQHGGQQRQPARISIRQKGTNLELGAKWEFRDGALAVTGAIFHSANKNELRRIRAIPPYSCRSASAR